MNKDIKNIKNFIHNDALEYGKAVIYQLKTMGINTNVLLDKKYNKQLFLRSLINKIFLRILNYLSVVLNGVVKHDYKYRKITKNQLIGHIAEDLSIADFLLNKIDLNPDEKTAFQNYQIDCGLIDLRSKYQEKVLRDNICKLYKSIRV